MSSASGVNVIRYTALALGVFYGFSHQRTINASTKAAAAKKEYEHKQELIEKARAEFAKSKSPAASAPAAEKSALNQDPMSSNFDLEAYFNEFIKQNP